jgi:transcriptional regulator with XRE-family HTH domain
MAHVVTRCTISEAAGNPRASAVHDHPTMTTRDRAADRGARLARHDLVAIGTDIRIARIVAGVSQATVGRACGISASQVGRTERAALRNVTAMTLARIGAVVGLDVRIRSYPSSTPLRDVAQIELLRRFRHKLAATLAFPLEVPLRIEGDQRAWDGVVRGLVGVRPTIPAEAETRLYDLQAQVRRIQLKCRDADEPHVLLLVAATHTNRRIVREAGTLLADLFPVSGREAMAALRAGRHPGGSALIFV